MKRENTVFKQRFFSCYTSEFGQTKVFTQTSYFILSLLYRVCLLKVLKVRKRTYITSKFSSL